MDYITAAPACSPLDRTRHIVAIVLRACALGALLALPSGAQAFDNLSLADLEMLDEAMAAHQPVSTSGVLQTAPDDARKEAVSEHESNGPSEDKPEMLPGQDYAIRSDVVPRAYASFGEDVKAIKWEFAAVAGYYTLGNAPKLFKDPQWPTIKKEGWFGRSTKQVGVDKLAHAYSSYLISEVLYARIKRKTGDAPGIELTAAALASGVMLWTEAFDSIEPDSGWSWEDVTFNTLGAGFSVLRNSVPGLDRKLDYRLMIQPNEDIYTLNGKEHFRQQRYLLAMKFSGFETFETTPLRFVELHIGYRGDDFLDEDRAAGISPKRHVFVGLGINFRELLFKNARSRAGRAAGEVLDYFQPPFTAVHHDLTE